MALPAAQWPWVQRLTPAPASGGDQDPENVRYVSSLSEKLEFFPGVDVRGNVLMEYKRGGCVGCTPPLAAAPPHACTPTLTADRETRSTKLKLDVWFNTAFVNGDTLVIEKLGVDKLKKDTDNRKVVPTRRASCVGRAGDDSATRAAHLAPFPVPSRRCLRTSRSPSSSSR